MDLGPHAGFIIGAYLVAVVVVAALVIWAVPARTAPGDAPMRLAPPAAKALPTPLTPMKVWQAIRDAKAAA